MLKCLTTERFHGDTLENFRTCSKFDGNGQLLFDKRKEPYFYEKSTYAARGIAKAFYFALSRAQELNHTPIVFSGRFSIFSRNLLTLLCPLEPPYLTLPAGTHFPVERVWVCKDLSNPHILLSGTKKPNP